MTETLPKFRSGRQKSGLGPEVEAAEESADVSPTC
jgi:hypothetical protein